MNYSTNIGFTIPNSNYSFKLKKLKLIDDYLFIITELNEVLVYKKENNKTFYKKKYIFLTSKQKRENIFDLFIMNNNNEKILTQNKKILIVISDNLIIFYINLSDGVCFDKINLINFKENNKILNISSINERFLFIIFNQKAFLFDVQTQIIFSEELFRYKKKHQINSILENININNNNNNNNHHFLSNKNKNNSNENNNNIEYINFTVNKIYKIKSNSFFLLTENFVTYFLTIEKINELNNNNNNLNYNENHIKITKKENFKIEKILKENVFFTLFQNNEFIFHNYFDSLNNNIIKISFLDSIEELTEISNFHTKSKFNIIYLNKILFNNEENLLIIFKDFKCQLFIYDKKIREIKLKKEFQIEISNKNENFNFLTHKNFLIIFDEIKLFFYDFNNLNNNKKSHEFEINLLKIIEKKEKNIFFTNYFSLNFSDYIDFLLKKITFNEKEKEIKISSSLIWSFNENNSIYYIIGTENGKILIFDIFFNENLNLNPILIIKSHTKKIEYLNIYKNNILISASIDGLISFTDISKEKINSTVNNVVNSRNEYLINLEKQNNEKITASKLINILITDVNINSLLILIFNPQFLLKRFYKLKRVLNVKIIDEENKNYDKKNLIGFVFDNNEVVIVDANFDNSNNKNIIYEFNQNNKEEIESIFQIIYQNVFIFYLSNDSIKIVNYSTKNCDRIIKNHDYIMKILRVKEKIFNFFNKSEKIENIILNNNNNNNKNFDDKKLNFKDFNLNQINFNVFKKLSFKSEAEKKIIFQKISQNLKNFKQKLNLIENSNKNNILFHINQNQNLILDKILTIINSNFSDNLKFIKIFNILNFPEFHLNLTENEFNSFENGIGQTHLIFGNQNSQILLINFDEYFKFIEKNIEIFGGNTSKYIHRINYFNFISIFHVWSLLIENDFTLFNEFKIFQPIFEFLPILIGIDSFSIVLNNENKENLNNEFKNHFEFFSEFISLNENEKQNKKKNISNLFFNVSLILNKYQNFLVNLNNYKFSNSLSHFMKIGFFGSLISTFAEKQNNEKISFCMKEEKNVLIKIYLKKIIKFSNFQLIFSFFFNNNNNIIFQCNNFFIFNEFLLMKILDSKNNNNNNNNKFSLLLKNIIEYFNDFYQFIFDLNNNNLLYENFEMLTKENNLINKKYDYCSNFELFLVYFLINFHKNNNKNFDINNNNNNNNNNNINNNININNINNNNINNNLYQKLFHLLIIFIFKIISNKPIFIKNNYTYCKIIMDLLVDYYYNLDIIYNNNIKNLALFFLHFYDKNTIEHIQSGKNNIKLYKIEKNIFIMKSNENQYIIKVLLLKVLSEYSIKKFNILIEIIENEFNYILNFTKKNNNEIIENNNNNNINNNNINNNNNNHNEKKKNKINKFKNAILNNIPQIKIHSNKISNPKYYSNLIEILFWLINKKSYETASKLPTVINIIMSTKNPSIKEIRESCLEINNQVFSDLYKNFPMLNYNSQSKRIAVGTIEGNIIIYDFDNGNLWKKFIYYKRWKC